MPIECSCLGYFSFIYLCIPFSCLWEAWTQGCLELATTHALDRPSQRYQIPTWAACMERPLKTSCYQQCVLVSKTKLVALAIVTLIVFFLVSGCKGLWSYGLCGGLQLLSSGRSHSPVQPIPSTNEWCSTARWPGRPCYYLVNAVHKNMSAFTLSQYDWSTADHLPKERQSDGENVDPDLITASCGHFKRRLCS